MILKILAVFMISMVELWAAIPAGFAFGLPALIIGFASGLGSIAGTVVAIFAGEKLRMILLHGKDPKNQTGLAGWLVTKGVPAMALLGPVLIGPTFTGALGAAVGAERRRFILFMTGGIVLWTVILVGLGAFGISLFSHG